MSASDTEQGKVRPNAQWWFVEDWRIVLQSLEFARSYARPHDVPRWRIDNLILRVEMERDRSLGRLEQEERDKPDRSKRDRVRYEKRKAEREQRLAS